ncbi:MAG: hypothetical protein KC646_02740 [Candidatus Cloacimonetes bacterium]|nr:hypothetical protein [Candidatus Cloacimonadota bacterium]
MKQLGQEKKGLLVFFIASLNASTRDISGVVLKQNQKKDRLIPRIIYDHVDYSRYDQSRLVTTYSAQGAGIPIYINNRIENNTFKSVYYLELEVPVGEYDFSLFFKGGKKKYDRSKKLAKIIVKKGAFHLIQHVWKSNRAFATNEVMDSSIRESYIACLNEFKDYIQGFPISDSDVKLELLLSLDYQEKNRVFLENALLQSRGFKHYADVKFKSFNKRRYGLFKEKSTVTSNYSLRFKDITGLENICYRLKLKGHIFKNASNIDILDKLRAVRISKDNFKVSLDFNNLSKSKNRVCVDPKQKNRTFDIEAKRGKNRQWKFEVN